MKFKIVTRKEKKALKNWLECFLSEKDGCDPSDDYLEDEWKDLIKSVKRYLKK
ncbi:MAG: hypothetical protein WC283_03325 [Candidatus Paceibacterota bacterium]|jgi:hypothetical protein